MEDRLTGRQIETYIHKEDRWKTNIQTDIKKTDGDIHPSNSIKKTDGKPIYRETLRRQTEDGYTDRH